MALFETAINGNKPMIHKFFWRQQDQRQTGGVHLFLRQARFYQARSENSARWCLLATPWNAV